MTSQNWDPETYARNARFVSDLGRDVLDLLSPRPGERVLDLGCGDGALTERLVLAGCSVVGIDSSPAQVAAACARGLDAHVGGAEDLTFDNEFDAVFSNAVLHWIPAAEEVIESVYRALKPGGRFVGEFGGSGNVTVIRQALAQALSRRGVDFSTLDPWLFPTAEEYCALLQNGGFSVSSVALLPRPTALPTDMSAWLETFAQPFLAVFDSVARQEVNQEVCEIVRPLLYEAGRGWSADYVRLRFAAERPL